MFGIMVIAWLAASVLVAVAANTRGRNPIGWFLAAAVISPLFAGLLVLALPSATFDAGPINIESRVPMPAWRAIGIATGLVLGGILLAALIF